MRNRILGTVVLLLLCVVGVYMYFSGKEYIVRISEPQIKAAIEKKLPLTKTYLLVIDVTLKNPRVKLIGGSDRIAGGMDVELNIRINESPKSLGGSIDLSGGVTYVSKEGSFFLTNPVVEKLSAQGVAENIKPTVNKAIKKALTEYFNRNPIYTLKKGDVKQLAAFTVLRNVTVENSELIVVLGI